MTRLALTITFLVVFSTIASAQAPEGSITGKVIDGGDQKIIDAATISLYKAKDSSLVKINLADKSGNFLFERVPFGTYYLFATSTGHRQTFSSAVRVNSASPIKVGVLQLATVAKTLADVNITASIKKPFIERKIDRTIMNVDAAISNAGTTALEVLEKSPRVTVDKDGNISLKGKQGVTIMLDGRPSYLSGEQLTNLLKNMPSSELDQIEIMTNPSAKYDAAGNSGIINIKTKKNKLKGLNGSITAGITQAKYASTSNSINLNYRKGKINAFANIDYSYWKGWQDLSIYRKFRDTLSKQVQTIFNQETIMNHSSTWQNL